MPFCLVDTDVLSLNQIECDLNRLKIRTSARSTHTFSAPAADYYPNKELEL